MSLHDCKSRADRGSSTPQGVDISDPGIALQSATSVVS